jgi:hypothetical protein
MSRIKGYHSAHSQPLGRKINEVIFNKMNEQSKRPLKEIEVKKHNWKLRDKHSQ